MGRVIYHNFSRAADTACSEMPFPEAEKAAGEFFEAAGSQTADDTKTLLCDALIESAKWPGGIDDLKT